MRDLQLQSGICQLPTANFRFWHIAAPKGFAASQIVALLSESVIFTIQRLHLHPRVVARMLTRQQHNIILRPEANYPTGIHTP